MAWTCTSGKTQICIIDGDGTVVLEQRIRTEPRRLADVLGSRARTRIVLEGSTESEWVTAALETLGHEVIHPSYGPQLAFDRSGRFFG